MNNLNYLMDNILYQIFKIIFKYIIKKHERVTGNSPIKIYVNKTENRIIFRIKTGCYLEMLTPETIILLGSTKNKTTKEKKWWKYASLKITEVVLVHCNIVKNDCQQDSRVLYTFIPNKSFGQLLSISPKSFTFFKNLKVRIFIHWNIVYCSKF